jgi:AhpD family alkylhydroperoxidase
MSPRIALIEPAQAPLLARPYFGGAATSPIVASLAHVPELLEVAMPFVGTVLGPSAIDVRTKELVIVRTSARLRCSYCVLTHSVAALDGGVTVSEVRALRADEGWGDAFPDARERALLEWVDAVAGEVGPVPDSAGAALREHYGEPEIAELTLLCAATVMLNRYCTALELPVSAATLERLADERLR